MQSFNCKTVYFSALCGTAAALCALSFAQTARAAEPGWYFDQLTNAQGKQFVYLTARALSVSLPKPSYRIFSFAPKWDVIYINDRSGSYYVYQHNKFLGSIMGRLGNQLDNDTQMLALPPNPVIAKDKGLEYALYNHTLKVTAAERKQLLIKNSATVLYAPRAIKAKYMRVADTPKEPNEIICKVSCVPMSSDFPIDFNVKDGFGRMRNVMTTARMNREKAVTITPPDLKRLKLVKTEQELFSHAHVSDVFELFGDTEKK